VADSGEMTFANLIGLVVGLFVWLLLTGALVNSLRQPYRKIDEALRPHWIAATAFTVACLAVVLAWGAALVGLVRFVSGYPGPASGILGLAIVVLVVLELYDGRTTATARRLWKRFGEIRPGAHGAGGRTGVEQPGASSGGR